jgi:hypothetical protein
MHRSMVGGGGWESEGGGERGEERGSSTRDAIVIFSRAKSVEVVCEQELVVTVLAVVRCSHSPCH